MAQRKIVDNDADPIQLWDPLVSFLSIQDVLQARAVCQQWKNALHKHTGVDICAKELWRRLHNDNDDDDKCGKLYLLAGSRAERWDEAVTSPEGLHEMLLMQQQQQQHPSNTESTTNPLHQFILLLRVIQCMPKFAAVFISLGLVEGLKWDGLRHTWSHLEYRNRSRCGAQGESPGKKNGLSDRQTLPCDLKCPLCHGHSEGYSNALSLEVECYIPDAPFTEELVWTNEKIARERRRLLPHAPTSLDARRDYLMIHCRACTDFMLVAPACIRGSTHYPHNIWCRPLCAHQGCYQAVAFPESADPDWRRDAVNGGLADLRSFLFIMDDPPPRSYCYNCQKSYCPEHAWLSTVCCHG